LTRAANAALARPGPIAAATSAGVEPGATSRTEPSGRRILKISDMGPPLERGVKTVKAKRMSDVSSLDLGSGRILACRRRPGSGPTLIFLPGYMSDMEGGKATALDGWAESQNRAMIRFDYAGCGASAGAFEDQTLSGWRDDVIAVIDRLAEGPVVLVGSSMGGWLMLLAALERPDRMAGLIGIAAAPDFTEWGFTPEQKNLLLAEGRLEEPSPYGEAPYVTTRALWESGQSLRLLEGEIAIDCPVRLLHGLADADVPWRVSLRLMEQLRSSDTRACLIKDGDHRLSRDGDIAILLSTANELMITLDKDT
jgi:pimeloyl-ACP methyl ester carboxylesterase